MNPKEQAEGIVQRFEVQVKDSDNEMSLTRDEAIQCAIIALEILIEALEENIEHGAFTDQNTAIRQQIKGYKEVLKAIKNME